MSSDPVAAPTGADSLARELRVLHALAVRYREIRPAGEPATELRAAYVHGERLPWRLIETRESGRGARARRWMLCFESCDELRHCLDERLAWCRADGAFVAMHASAVSGFPGVSADWVPSKDFADVFAAERESLRARICRTAAGRTIAL